MGQKGHGRVIRRPWAWMIEFDKVSKSYWTGTQRKVILNQASFRVELGRWECLNLCVSERAHAVFRYGQAPKRPANIMAS